MGGSQSTTAVKSLSQTINTIAMQTVQECVVMTDQSQNVNVTNTGFRLFGSYQIKQTSEVRSDCFSDISKQLQLQNGIIAAIAQSSTSQNVALLGAFGVSKSEAIANLTNTVRNSVQLSNIQKSYNEIKQTQTVTFSNSGVEIGTSGEVLQGAALFAAATIHELDKSGVFNQIGTYVDQKSSATMENPLDFIAKAINAVGFSLSMGLVFFVVIIAAILFGLVYLGNAGSSSGNTANSGGNASGNSAESLTSSVGSAAQSFGFSNPLASGTSRMGFGGKVAAAFGFNPKKISTTLLNSGAPLPANVRAAAMVSSMTG